MVQYHFSIVRQEGDYKRQYPRDVIDAVIVIVTITVTVTVTVIVIIAIIDIFIFPYITDFILPLGRSQAIEQRYALSQSQVFHQSNILFYSMVMITRYITINSVDNIPSYLTILQGVSQIDTPRPPSVGGSFTCGSIPNEIFWKLMCAGIRMGQP